MGLRLQIRRRGARAAEELRADRLILCTGIPLDDQRGNDTLVSRLRERGLLQCDDLGLGAQCDPQDALLDAVAWPQAMLHTLGTPLKGQLWESIAVPELRRQARELARRLLLSLPQPLQTLLLLVTPSSPIQSGAGLLLRQLAVHHDQESPDTQLQCQQVQATGETNREIDNAFLGMFI